MESPPKGLDKLPYNVEILDGGFSFEQNKKYSLNKPSGKKQKSNKSCFLKKSIKTKLAKMTKKETGLIKYILLRQYYLPT